MGQVYCQSKESSAFTPVCHTCFHFSYMTQMERIERTGYKINFKEQTLAISSIAIFNTHHFIPYYLIIATSCHMPSYFIPMSLHRDQALPSMWNEPLPCFSWQTVIHLLYIFKLCLPGQPPLNFQGGISHSNLCACTVTHNLPLLWHHHTEEHLLVNLVILLASL